jgi:hypothetical protein
MHDRAIRATSPLLTTTGLVARRELQASLALARRKSIIANLS